MNARLSPLLLLLLLLGTPGAAQAQSVRLGPDQEMTLLAESGYNRAVLPLSLTWATGIRSFERPGALGVTWTMPLLSPDFGDGRGRLFAQFDVFKEHGWMIRVNHGWAVLSTRNDAFSALGLVTDLGAILGWSQPSWMLGMEIRGGVHILSHVTTTSWARNQGGSPLHDALLSGTGWDLRAGVRAGLLLGAVELALRSGWDRLGVYTITPPLFIELGLGGRFSLPGKSRKARRHRRRLPRGGRTHEN